MKQFFIVFAVLSIFISGVQARAMEILKVPGRVQLTLDPMADHKGKMVDILFVVDNSGSMQSHQENLVKNADFLVSQLKGVDFNAGVISTDTEDSVKAGVINWISSQEANWDAKLRRNFNLGMAGSGTERPFDSILSSILASGLINKGFYRDGADLVIVLLTDAEDQSSVSPADFMNQVTQFKGGPEHVGFHGLIIPSGAALANACTRDQPDSTPKRIEEVITAMKGVTASICDSTMVQGLSDIGADIKKRSATVPAGVPYSFSLPLAPDLATMTVTYGPTLLVGGDLDFGWAYLPAKQEIIFGAKLDWAAAPAGTKLVVTYVPADWQK